MLPRQHRLLRSADFVATARHGSRAGDRLLVVHRRSTQEVDAARVGFVVSRAVGGSVVRSRVKRRLRHAVLARLDELDPGEQVVVRAQPALAAASHDELVGSLDRCLQRAGATRRPPGVGTTTEEVGAR